MNIRTGCVTGQSIFLANYEVDSRFGDFLAGADGESLGAPLAFFPVEGRDRAVPTGVDDPGLDWIGENGFGEEWRSSFDHEIAPLTACTTASNACAVEVRFPWGATAVFVRQAAAPYLLLPYDGFTTYAGVSLPRAAEKPTSLMPGYWIEYVPGETTYYLHRADGVRAAFPKVTYKDADNANVDRYLLTRVIALEGPTSTDAPTNHATNPLVALPLTELIVIRNVYGRWTQVGNKIFSLVNDPEPMANGFKRLYEVKVIGGNWVINGVPKARSITIRNVSDPDAGFAHVIHFDLPRKDGGGVDTVSYWYGNNGRLALAGRLLSYVQFNRSVTGTPRVDLARTVRGFPFTATNVLQRAFDYNIGLCDPNSPNIANAITTVVVDPSGVETEHRFDITTGMTVYTANSLRARSRITSNIVFPNLPYQILTCTDRPDGGYCIDDAMAAKSGARLEYSTATSTRGMLETHIRLPDLKVMYEVVAFHPAEDRQHPGFPRVTRAGPESTTVTRVVDDAGRTVSVTTPIRTQTMRIIPCVAATPNASGCIAADYYVLDNEAKLREAGNGPSTFAADTWRVFVTVQGETTSVTTLDRASGRFVAEHLGAHGQLLVEAVSYTAQGMPHQRFDGVNSENITVSYDNANSPIGTVAKIEGDTIESLEVVYQPGSLGEGFLARSEDTVTGAVEAWVQAPPTLHDPVGLGADEVAMYSATYGSDTFSIGSEYGAGGQVAKDVIDTGSTSYDLVVYSEHDAESSGGMCF